MNSSNSELGQINMPSTERAKARGDGYTTYLEALKNPLSDLYITTLTSCLDVHHKSLDKEGDVLRELIGALPEDFDLQSLKDKCVQQFFEWEKIDWEWEDDGEPTQEEKDAMAQTVSNLIDEAFAEFHTEETVRYVRKKMNAGLSGLE